MQRDRGARREGVLYLRQYCGWEGRDSVFCDITLAFDGLFLLFVALLRFRDGPSFAVIKARMQPRC